MNNKVLIFLLPFLLSGCAQIGNILIPAHPKSLKKSESIKPEALKFFDNAGCEEIKEEEGNSLMSATASSVVIKAIGAVLARDKQQYNASFSAINSVDKFNAVQCIKFNPQDDFDFPIVLSSINSYRNFLKIEEGKKKISKVSNKVAAYPLVTAIYETNPFSGETWDQVVGNALGFINPFMMIHAIWGAFDESLYKTDIVAKIKIAPIINVNGENKFADIASQEIIHKIGRFNVLTGKITDAKEPFSYYPNPVNSNNSGDVPANVSITIIEKNEVGDYIGKASELLK